MSIIDFLNVGTTLSNGINKKRRVADASDVTKFVRIAATFRPYVGGGVAKQRYLPKAGGWSDMETARSWSQGYRFGPIFDAQFRRG